jgi:hypothetical protein
MSDAAIPAPLAKYLRRALGESWKLIRRVELRQVGELRTSPSSRRWLRFSAVEVVKPLEVAFLWDAHVRVMPLVNIRVQDCYAAGQGAGTVSICSVVITKDRGSRELNIGSLLRFLAEAAWYPSALIPSEKLRWQKLDSSRALAELTDGQLTVALEFRFDASGDLAAIYTDARPRKTRAGYEMSPWEGRFANYATRDGLRVPLRAEVGWYTAGAWSPVWRGEIVSASYCFA